MEALTPCHHCICGNGIWASRDRPVIAPGYYPPSRQRPQAGGIRAAKSREMRRYWEPTWKREFRWTGWWWTQSRRTGLRLAEFPAYREISREFAQKAPCSGSLAAENTRMLKDLAAVSLREQSREFPVLGKDQTLSGQGSGSWGKCFARPLPCGGAIQDGRTAEGEEESLQKA